MYLSRLKALRIHGDSELHSMHVLLDHSKHLEEFEYSGLVMLTQLTSFNFRKQLPHIRAILVSSFFHNDQALTSFLRENCSTVDNELVTPLEYMETGKVCFDDETLVKLAPLFKRLVVFDTPDLSLVRM